MKLRTRSLSIGRCLKKSEVGVKTGFPCRGKENPTKGKTSRFPQWDNFKGRLRRKSSPKTLDLNKKQGLKTWILSPEQNLGQDRKDEEEVEVEDHLDEAFTTEKSPLSSSPCAMLHSTPRLPKDVLRSIVDLKMVTVRARSSTLDPVTMARITSLETPSPLMARRRAQEAVRRTLMEKSLEAVIEEARMELRREKESPEKMPIYQNVDFDYENGNFVLEEEDVDMNGNFDASRESHSYQNLEQSAFYENVDLQYSLGQHSYEIIGFPCKESEEFNFLTKNYEDMACRVLSETYVEMTPVKSKLVTAV